MEFSLQTLRITKVTTEKNLRSHGTIGLEVATRIGFKHIQTIKMMLTTRPGVGNDRKEGREKWEGVYVFSKN